MRPIVTTFIGVLLALLAYEGIRYATRQASEPDQADLLAEMSSDTEKQAVASNWNAVQSYVELLTAQGKYTQARDFAAAHVGERPVDFNLGPGVKVDSKTLQRAAKAAEESLKTPDARLDPLDNSDSLLWPPLLEHHEQWRLEDLGEACGKRIAGCRRSIPKSRCN